MADNNSGEEESYEEEVIITEDDEEEVITSSSEVEIEEEIVVEEEAEFLGDGPESDGGWTDQDDVTSIGEGSGVGTLGFSSHHSHHSNSPASGKHSSSHHDEDVHSPTSQSQTAATTATTSSGSTKRHRKKKKKKHKKKNSKWDRDEPDGYHGREVDMEYVKETGKEHYRVLREKKRELEAARKKAEEERLLAQKLKEEEAASTYIEEESLSEKTIDFRNDPIEEMTGARRFALQWLYKKEWYRRLANGAADDVDQFGDGVKTPPPSDQSSFKSGHMSFGMDADNDDDKPSLAKAWAYFEHVSLDRYIVEEKEDRRDNNPYRGFKRLRRRFFAGERELRRAAPGTKDVKTRLFDPFNTPHSQLGNFGIAVGLYFSTVRVVGLICFIAGLINCYSMYYFSSDAYMPEAAREDVPLLQQGSAVCTDTTWVLCRECNCTDDDPNAWESRKRWESDRCASVNISDIIFDDTTGFGESLEPFALAGNLTFALKNNCDATVWQVAAFNYASIIFIMLSIFILGKYLAVAEVDFDEDLQTAQDYSITITNPPGDATDPEEWRDYFRDQCDGAEVTVCTCALDNDLLVQALVKRRETFRSIRNALPPNTPLDLLNIAQLAAQQERERTMMSNLFAKILPGIPENFAFLVVMNARIQALAQLKYSTTRVFVSFEKEEDQRHVLETLMVGSYRAKRNMKSALPDPKYLFRGKHVLNVQKATEPNTIHWRSLNVPYIRKIRQQLLTNFITLISIVGVAMVVRYVNEWSAIFAALTISAFNAGFPEAAKIIVLLESHDNEGSKQRSLFFKIAAFRWVNTAIVISLITPFTSTISLDNGLIPQVYAIFFSEVITLNVIQLADGYGHFRRLCVAPLMKNQDAMNLWFRGEEVELAERYTNMTKIFFLALWYSSIYPGAFFMAAVALFINYFTDRFGIMRTWKRAAHLGSEVSAISRKYFFSLANISMAFISAYYWAGFPFDNLCDTGDSVGIENGPFKLEITPDPDEALTTYTATVAQGDAIYTYCSQDMFDGFSFPFIPSQQEGRGDWMTPTQEQITTIFGWSSLGVLFIVCCRLAWGLLKGCWTSRRGRFKAIGDVQGINFSEVPLISTYIPQVETWMFSYPLVVCDSDAFRKSLFDWEDPEKPHGFYDLTKDAEDLMKSDAWFDKKKCFSQVRYWDYSEENDSSSSSGEEED